MDLFSITTIDREEYPRTVAVCTSLEEAKHLVEGNYGDMHELTCDLVVIEYVQPNIINPPINEKFPAVWYSWDGTAEEGKYKECPPPKVYTCAGNIGIG